MSDNTANVCLNPRCDGYGHSEDFHCHTLHVRTFGDAPLHAVAGCIHDDTQAGVWEVTVDAGSACAFKSLDPLPAWQARLLAFALLFGADEADRLNGHV